MYLFLVCYIHVPLCKSFKYVPFTIKYCNGSNQHVARQQLGKHGPLRSNKMNVYSSLLGDSQRANVLTRWISHDLFYVWSTLRKNRTVFSVRGLCKLLAREVNSDAKSVQGSYEWIIAAEAREQASTETAKGSS
jgi:hypothetical protein